MLSNRILLKESQVPGAIIFVVVSSREEKAVNWERGTETHLAHQVLAFYPGGRRNFLIWVFFFLCLLSKSNLVSFSIAKEEGTNEKLIRQEVNTTEACLPDSVCHPEQEARACPKWLPSNNPSLLLEDDAVVRNSFLFWLVSCFSLSA